MTLENLSWTSKCLGVFDGKTYQFLFTTLLALYIKFILQRIFVASRWILDFFSTFLFFVNVILRSSARNLDLSLQCFLGRHYANREISK